MTRAADGVFELSGGRALHGLEDSYNRLVRDMEELYACRRCIEGNPAKARLRADEFTLAMNDVLRVAS